MFELLELSLADTRRMFAYKQNCEMQIAFGLKGFTYNVPFPSNGGLRKVN
jgi:hypothetical protein